MKNRFEQLFSLFFRFCYLKAADDSAAAAAAACDFYIWCTHINISFSSSFLFLWVPVFLFAYFICKIYYFRMESRFGGNSVEYKKRSFLKRPCENISIRIFICSYKSSFCGRRENQNQVFFFTLFYFYFTLLCSALAAPCSSIVFIFMTWIGDAYWFSLSPAIPFQIFVSSMNVSIFSFIFIAVFFFVYPSSAYI